jgi:hypothetical protein
MFNEKVPDKNKFHRLSMYIACHWVYDEWFSELFEPIKPPNGPKSKPKPEHTENTGYTKENCFPDLSTFATEKDKPKDIIDKATEIL